MSILSIRKLAEQTRDVAALTMRGDVSSVDDKSRTVDVTFSTGARVLRTSWFGDRSYEELSMNPTHVRMGRLQSGSAPFLADHYGSIGNVLGVITSARLEDGKGIATVRFPPEGVNERSDQAFKMIAAGILRNVSVGYRTYRAEKAGKVASGDDEIPVFRAVDWEPHEVSAVAIGADAAAGVRSDQVQFNPCVFVDATRGEAVEKTEQEKQAEAIAEAKRALEAQNAEKARAAELEARDARVAQAERERVSAILKHVRGAKLDDAFADKLISGKVTIEKAREQILDAVATRSEQNPTEHHVAIEQGEHENEKWIRGMTAGVLARTGQLAVLSGVLASHKARAERDQNPDFLQAFAGFDPKDNGGEFRAMSLMDLARESLERRGVKTRGMYADKLLQRAIDFTRDNAAQQTASDFSVALENVMYKTLLGSYGQQVDTWRRFCGTDSVQDFRPSNRYRLGSFGTLDALGESGEYKQKQIPDAVKQQISTGTVGNKIALSRKAIINDDMGAVVASADRFGRMAGLSIEVAVYALLAQNANLGPTVTYNGITAPLFDAQFANIAAGAAFSAAAIDADRVKMASQVDISNNEKLDIRPNVLLVPLALGSTAKQLNRASYDPTPGAAFEAPNMVAGLFRDIVDTSRLSGTRRYMFSDQTPALLVVFLNGSQVPVMDQRPGWDIDGIEWKLRLDFAAQGFDPKGALTNAGV